MTIFKKQFLLFFICLALLACSEPSPTLRPLSASATILAFGDSLTHGNGAGIQQSYPAVLTELTGHEVINAGISGELSSDGLRRLPNLLKQYKPELVILCHGGNDILQKRDLSQTKDNIRQMITLSHQAGAAVMLLAVPRPSLTLTPPDLYQQLASETQTLINMDVLAEVLGSRELKSDTYHPNAAGYRKIAQTIYQDLHTAGALAD
jgi:lysophospholipase L1-like esterase